MSAHPWDGVLLLHGFTGAPESFDSLLPGLPAHLPVLRPALLGHGAASHATSFDDETQRLATLVAERGLRRVLLCGYSMGGRLALGLLARFPGRFTRAVVIGAHPGLEDAAERATRVATDEDWARLLEREGIHAFVRAWAQQPLFATQRRLPEAVLRAQREQRLRHHPEGLALALRTLGLGRMPPLAARLADLRVPVTLLVGEEDAKFAALARGLAPRMGAGARVHVEPRVGHNVLLERPEAVRTALRAP